ncbi:unnamed protein product, partial [Effrenium voratum]
SAHRVHRWVFEHPCGDHGREWANRDALLSSDRAFGQGVVSAALGGALLPALAAPSPTDGQLVPEGGRRAAAGGHYAGRLQGVAGRWPADCASRRRAAGGGGRPFRGGDGAGEEGGAGHPRFESSRGSARDE